MAVYNPEKNYHWEPNDKFEISGAEFATFYHLMNREFNNQGGATLALKTEAYNTMFSIFKRNIEADKIVEQVEEDPKTLANGEVVDPALTNLFK